MRASCTYCGRTYDEPRENVNDLGELVGPCDDCLSHLELELRMRAAEEDLAHRAVDRCRPWATTCPACDGVGFETDADGACLQCDGTGRVSGSLPGTTAFELQALDLDGGAA